METEIRFYYSLTEKEKINNYFKKIKDLEYQGTFYEKTDQYNHPMAKFDFYSKKIDGRFRVRQTINNHTSKCMITWKKRLKNNVQKLIHEEEEIEVSIDYSEYDNLKKLLENVLHLNLVESYERYRSVFKNDDIEIVVDEYPFGIAIEIENKNKNKDGVIVITNWIEKLKFNIEEAYKLSWDDKYFELCKLQNKTVESAVTFDKDMPQVDKKFDIK